MADEFFSRLDAEIRTFAKLLEKYLTEPSTEFLQGSYITKAKLVANYLIELNQKKAGNKATFAINNLGEQVEPILKVRGVTTKESLETDIDTLMNFLGQVAQELFLREDRGIGSAAIEILDYFYYSKERSNDEKFLGILFTAKLPIQIYNDIISSQKDTAAAKLADLQVKVDYVSKQYEALHQSEAEVKKLSEALEKQKVSFNFLGLSAAFSQFYKNKTTHKWQALAIMLVLGLALVGIPIFSLSNARDMNARQNYYKKVDDEILTLNKASINRDKQIVKQLKEACVSLESLKKELERDDFKKLFFVAIPVLAIELILLYFFRIALLSYTNSRSQMMQLELRNSVCQFIETYVNFRKENKEADSSFEKFEALVFSGLAPNDSQVPSTFDGLEQIGKLIKDLKVP